MDRYDEAKHVGNADEVNERMGEGHNTGALGDVLGLGRTIVPKMPGDPSAAEEAARGGTGALNEETRVTRNTATPQTPGATSIDMGVGGTATELDRE